MTRRERKAGDNFPNKGHPKKRPAPNQRYAKLESPAARAYRQKHAAKPAEQPAVASVPDPGPLDIYTFPATMPSPPPSDRPTPPAKSIDITTRPVEEEESSKAEQSVNHTPAISGSIPEETLLVILCGSTDFDLTETAFDAVMRHAAAAARPGDEFGIAFMRKFISQLAETHINEAWLAEVVDLFQRDLDRLVDRAQCQIRSLGKLALRKGKKPDVHDDAEEQGNVMQLDDTNTPNTLPSTAEAKGGTTTTEAANKQDDEKHQKSPVVPVFNKQKKQKTKDTRHLPSTPKKASQKRQPNNRTQFYHRFDAPLDSVSDLFVGSAIDARRFAVGEPTEVIKAYDNRVRKVWKRIGSDDRAAWVKLFNARPDAVSPLVKGQKLFESQGLLAKFLPDV